MSKSHATSQKMTCYKVALAYLPFWGYKVLPNEKSRVGSRLERYSVRVYCTVYTADLTLRRKKNCSNLDSHLVLYKFPFFCANSQDIGVFKALGRPFDGFSIHPLLVYCVRVRVHYIQWLSFSSVLHLHLYLHSYIYLPPNLNPSKFVSESK